VRYRRTSIYSDEENEEERSFFASKMQKKLDSKDVERSSSKEVAAVLPPLGEVSIKTPPRVIPSVKTPNQQLIPDVQSQV